MIQVKTIEKDEQYLRQISKEIDFQNDPVEEYMKDTKEYCIKANLYALACIQIGIPKRMIYIRNTNEDMNKNEDSSYSEDLYMINPVILSSSGKTRFLEGCGSCLDVVSVVERPYRIKVQYIDQNQKNCLKVLEGFEATVFSHEFDHLNGILHFDRSKEIYHMNREQMRQFRLIHPYEIIDQGELLI